MAWEVGKPLSIEEVEVAPPRSHEVRVKVDQFILNNFPWSSILESTVLFLKENYNVSLPFIYFSSICKADF